MSDFYEKVDSERVRQDKKWGTQHHNAHEWLAILIEEVGETAQGLNDRNPARMEHELIQVAAVAKAWYEDFWGKR